MIYGFKLTLEDEGASIEQIREDASTTIGTLAESAGALSLMHGMLSEGNIPSDKLIVHLGYACATLNKVVQSVSNQLETQEMKAKQRGKKQ